MPIALAANAIVTLATAQEYLGNDQSAAQDQMHLGINTLSSMFDEHCGYQLISKEYTDWKLDGRGDNILVLPAMNATVLTNVKYRASWTSYVALDSGYYELDTRTRFYILGNDFTFCRGERNYSATFTAGWTQATMPGAIVEALLAELARFIEKRADVQSLNMGGNSSSGRSFFNLRPQTYEALAPYKLLSV